MTDPQAIGEIVLRPQQALEHLAQIDPYARHVLERMLGAANAIVRDYNDDEIRGWAADGRTQSWIAEQCGVTQQAISTRFRRLGIEPLSNRGRPRNNNETADICISPAAEEPESPGDWMSGEPGPESPDEPGSLSDEPGPRLPEPPLAARRNGSRKSWVDQMRGLADSLYWIVRRRPPPAARLLEAKEILERMLGDIDALLHQPKSGREISAPETPLEAELVARMEQGALDL